MYHVFRVSFFFFWFVGSSSKQASEKKDGCKEKSDLEGFCFSVL